MLKNMEIKSHHSKKLKNMLGFEEEPITPEDAYYEGEETEKRSKDDFEINGNTMILLEPRAYSESQQIADYLKNRCAVVVNLKRVTPDQAKRIVDFLYGTIYAIGGDLQKLGGGIFLCTPKNVNVEGTISEENTTNNKTVSKNKNYKSLNYIIV